MNLTADEKAIIETCYAMLIENESDFAKCFYRNLFEMAPLIKPMFKRDTTLVEVHFNELIHTAVKYVENFEELKPELYDLGKKHRGFGVKAAQFKVVKASLLLSIEYALKGQFNTDVKTAWSHYIDQISAVMIAGLNGE